MPVPMPVPSEHSIYFPQLLLSPYSSNKRRNLTFILWLSLCLSLASLIDLKMYLLLDTLY